MKDTIRKHIDQLHAKGAHYVDARWYPREDSNFLFMWNGNLKENNASSQSGMGVRVLYNGAWGFSASSDLANPDAIFEKAFDNARIASVFLNSYANKSFLWIRKARKSRKTSSRFFLPSRQWVLIKTAACSAENINPGALVQPVDGKPSMKLIFFKMPIALSAN